MKRVYLIPRVVVHEGHGIAFDTSMATARNARGCDRVAYKLLNSPTHPMLSLYVNA